MNIYRGIMIMAQVVMALEYLIIVMLYNGHCLRFVNTDDRLNYSFRGSLRNVLAGIEVRRVYKSF